MNKGTAFLIAILTIFLGLTFWAMVIGWDSAGDVEMTGLVVGSMVLGILFSVVIGCGLMFLLFYSARRGYDEPVRQMRKDEEKLGRP
jgi:heme/copper-type cytochrome/quinol oxidase subunit 2